MTRSALPEETPSTPGWIDGRIDEVFATFGPGVAAVREAYADCLAGVRGEVDVDLGHDRCRAAALTGLEQAGIDKAALDEFNRTLEALEAEISAGT